MFDTDLELDIWPAFQKLSIRNSSARSFSSEDVFQHQTTSPFKHPSSLPDTSDSINSEYSASSRDSRLEQNLTIQPYPSIRTPDPRKKRVDRLPPHAHLGDDALANIRTNRTVFDTSTPLLADHRSSELSYSRITVAGITQMPTDGQRGQFTRPGLLFLSASCDKEPIPSSSEAQNESSTRHGNAIHEIQHDTEPRTDDGEQSRRSAKSQDMRQNKLLSCPFVKYNRFRYFQVYNSCTQRPGFRDPGKLVEHLKRVHSSQQGCSRCKTRFSGTEKVAREARLRHRTQGQCTPRELTDLEPEWMDANQERLLTSSVIRSRESPEDKWRSIYCFLFQIPKEQRSMVPTPWYDYLIPCHCQDELEAALLGFKATDKAGPVPDPTPSVPIGLCGTQLDSHELTISQHHLPNAATLPTGPDDTRPIDPVDMVVQEWVVPKLIDSGYESLLNDEGGYTVKNDPHDDLCPSNHPTGRLENSHIEKNSDYGCCDIAQQYSAEDFLAEGFLTEGFLAGDLPAEYSPSTLIGVGQWVDKDGHILR